jgi:hypothetical protein
MARTIAIALFLCVALMAPTAFADDLVGWITDEHCGAKGAKAEHKSCALSCAGRGAAFVFYNLADEKIYKLDDQEAAKKHVEVAGTVEESTIKVTSITEVEAE